VSVLLAGGSGLIGSAVARRLDARELVLLSRGGPSRGRLRFILRGSAAATARVVEGDVAEPCWGLAQRLDELRDVTTIVNLAGVTDWAADWSSLYRSNVVGPLEGLRLGEQLSERASLPVRVLTMGSVGATGQESGWVLEEPYQLPPNATDYERSKWLGERAFLRPSASSRTKKILLRITAVVDDESLRHPRRQGVQAYTQAVLRSGRPVLLYSRRGRIDLVYRSTAGEMIAKIIKQDVDVCENPFIGHIAAAERAPSVRSVVTAVNDELRSRGCRTVAAVPVPERALIRGSDIADGLLDMTTRHRNLLLGLRYFANERFASTVKMTRALPSFYPGAGLDLQRLAALLVDDNGGAGADARPRPSGQLFSVEG
jgi:nucleoside-diphosphate-sugar epimerase